MTTGICLISGSTRSSIPAKRGRFIIPCINPLPKQGKGLQKDGSAVVDDMIGPLQ
jgi:hypothetical protein